MYFYILIRLILTNSSWDNKIRDGGPKNSQHCTTGYSNIWILQEVLCVRTINRKLLEAWFPTNKYAFWNALLEETLLWLGTQLAFRSPEILAPARMPVAEGKKMENMPKKLPSGPRQPGTKFSAKISAIGHKLRHFMGTYGSVIWLALRKWRWSVVISIFLEHIDCIALWPR